MGYDGKPIGPDLTIVPVVLQYGVFPTLSSIFHHRGALSSNNTHTLGIKEKNHIYFRTNLFLV